MVQEATAKIEQILDSRVKIEGKALEMFVSSEITANGSAQSTAHGLKDADGNGRVPTLVWVVPTSIPTAAAGPITLVQGTHTTTNCVVTGTNDANNKYKIYAI